MQPIHWRDWIHSQREVLLELVRIYLGIGLLFKGIFFLVKPEMLAPPPGSPWMDPVIAAVPYIHIVGGLLLALGILTRLAALVQIPVLFVATFFVNLPRMQGLEAREGVEFSALVLFLLAVFLVRGSGSLSVARYWRKQSPAVRAAYQNWADRHTDLFMDLIRAYLGLGLLIKGIYILSHQTEFMGLVESTPGGMPFGIMAAAHYIIPVHLAGGAMLLLGFATRLAALAQIPLLIGAVFYIYLPRFSTLELRQNLEFTALVLFLLCVILVHGPGRYSIDYIARKKEDRDAMQLEPAHSVS